MRETVVVFPHVEGHWSAEETALQRELAQIMCASARKAMPGIKIKMMTDERTPGLSCADEVLRRPQTSAWIPWICDFCAQIDGQVLYLDTDLIVQKDLRLLFAVPGDALFTYRGPKEIDGRQMPFLFGVVAYRTRAFWAEVRDRVLAMPAIEDRNWWGSQVAVFEMWMEHQHGRETWRMNSVPCDAYNYTPKNPADAPADKWALHYKGKKRKNWMKTRWANLFAAQESCVAYQ